jgi:hypothetical protein
MTGAKVFFVRECLFVYSVCAKLYFLAPNVQMHGYLLQNDQFFIRALVKFLFVPQIILHAELLFVAQIGDYRYTKIEETTRIVTFYAFCCVF